MVKVNGKQHYFGKWGLRETSEAYQRFLTKYLSGTHEFGNSTSLSIVDLCAEYIQWAEHYYFRDGKQTDEMCVIRSVVETLLKHYGSYHAQDFDTTHLENLIGIYIQRGLSARTNI